jgi:carbon-monoxide dehydrogenase medium subunit
MYATRYSRPTTLAEALVLGADEDARYLSGGMTLLPTMKNRLAAPELLIDLAHIADMVGIVLFDGTVTIGAGTRHVDVATDPLLRQACPALADLAGLIGDRHVRNRGTLGGSIANNDPSADYPAAMLALAATVRTDRRAIAADDFFVGQFETALQPGEIVIGIGFTPPQRAAYQKFRHPASRYAVAGVFVADTGDGVRVAVTGAGADGVFRALDMEAALNMRFAPEALDGIGFDPADMIADLYASGEYRAQIAAVLAKRAVAAALG